MRGDATAVPPPVPRLAAAPMLAALEREHGVRLADLGPAPGGEVGGVFVRWPDGHDGVLTRAGDGSPRWAAALRETAAVLDRARAAGTPVPRYELVAGLGDAHVVVQTRLPGTPPGTVDAPLVQAMLTLTAGWRGLLADRLDLEPVSLHLRSSGPGFCLHESLAVHDRRTRDLLARVRAVGEVRDALDGVDLVHLDYHPGNVLVDAGGRVTGVVDWDGWGRGDRWFSVEVLAFDLARRRADPALRAHVDELVRGAVAVEHLRAYRAHLALRQVDWAIRHHGAADVQAWLGIATARLGALDA